MIQSNSPKKFVNRKLFDYCERAIFVTFCRRSVGAVCFCQSSELRKVPTGSVCVDSVCGYFDPPNTFRTISQSYAVFQLLKFEID